MKLIPKEESISYCIDICMESKELWEQFDLDYCDQLLHLKKKYGLPQGNYFLKESCKSVNNKISKAKEGLYIHHDKEWNPDDFECHSLSTPELALEKPFDYQLSANLTYCNLLEHFLLHVKIHKLRRDVFGCEDIDGCEKFLIPQLYDMYITRIYRKPHLVATKEKIQNNYSDYMDLLVYYSNEFGKDLEYLRKLTLRDPNAFAWKKDAKFSPKPEGDGD